MTRETLQKELLNLSQNFTRENVLSLRDELDKVQESPCEESTLFASLGRLAFSELPVNPASICTALADAFVGGDRQAEITKTDAVKVMATLYTAYMMTK